MITWEHSSVYLTDDYRHFSTGCVRTRRRIALPGVVLDGMTLIGEARKVEGIALALHDLRHRRISLLHARGVPRARIGEELATP